MVQHSASRIFLVALLFALLFIPALFLLSSFSDTPPTDMLRGLLNRECINLDRNRMFTLITVHLGPEREHGPSPGLFRIMEGVIKRTDFDGIAEEKTVRS